MRIWIVGERSGVSVLGDRECQDRTGRNESKVSGLRCERRSGNKGESEQDKERGPAGVDLVHEHARVSVVSNRRECGTFRAERGEKRAAAQASDRGIRPCKFDG